MFYILKNYHVVLYEYWISTAAPVYFSAIIFFNRYGAYFKVVIIRGLYLHLKQNNLAKNIQEKYFWKKKYLWILGFMDVLISKIFYNVQFLIDIKGHKCIKVSIAPKFSPTKIFWRW